MSGIFNEAEDKLWRDVFFAFLAVPGTSGSEALRYAEIVLEIYQSKCRTGQYTPKLTQCLCSCTHNAKTEA